MAAEKAAGIVVALATGLLSNDITVPVIGVGATTIVGAALGTLAALGYDNNPPRPGGRLVIRSLSTIVMASLLVGGLPAITGWHWNVQAAEGAVTGLTAIAVYYLFDQVKKWAQGQLTDLKLSDFIPWMRKRTPTAPDPGQNAPSNDEAPRP